MTLARFDELLQIQITCGSSNIELYHSQLAFRTSAEPAEYLGESCRITKCTDVQARAINAWSPLGGKVFWCSCRTQFTALEQKSGAWEEDAVPEKKITVDSSGNQSPLLLP